MTRFGWLRRRTRRDLLAASLVLAGLTGFVVLVYVVLVLGGGLLLGHTSSPLVGLSVLATAVVALAFDPVQNRLEAAASLIAHGGQVSPYDALLELSRTATGTYAAEELPARIAHVLADGTAASWSQVWLVVDGHPTLAATWPPSAGAGSPDGPPLDPFDTSVPGRNALPVRNRGELLGVLVVQEGTHGPLDPVEQRLVAGLAAQAGLVLRGARLRAELAGRATELSERADQLRASLQRLVDVQDEKRRLLERDIHDGAQQHLVALAVNLRLAQTLADGSPERAADLLAAQAPAAEEAIEALVTLARGIYPPLLASEGLTAALRAASRHTPIPVDVTATGVGRYPARLESAAYFCCLEALQNAAKHSGATRIHVEVEGGPGSLCFTVDDDGRGFDPDTTPEGVGLAGMRDRIESVGGTLTRVPITSGGTRIRARLPAPSPVTTAFGRGA